MYNPIPRRSTDPRCTTAAERMYNAGFTAAAETLAERWDSYSPYKQGRMLNEYFAA